MHNIYKTYDSLYHCVGIGLDSILQLIAGQLQSRLPAYQFCSCLLPEMPVNTPLNDTKPLIIDTQLCESATHN